MRGKVVGITDGDTLTLLVDRTQHKISLAEIDTPERGQDWGTRARQALADKVFQKDVNVDVTDVDQVGHVPAESFDALALRDHQMRNDRKQGDGRQGDPGRARSQHCPTPRPDGEAHQLDHDEHGTEQPPPLE